MLASTSIQRAGHGNPHQAVARGDSQTQGGALVSPDVIGWAASAVLIATLAWQIHIQSRDPNARGVSRWLFAGQMLASTGFILYSWMLDNWVFIVTNVVIL